MEKTYWVYILASALGGTLYIGVTNNLVRRIYEHRMGLADGFTKNIESIGWCTSSDTMMSRWPFSGKSGSRNGTGPGKFG
jgi:predicted GIY-YIG superfamily endonuclease